MLRTRVGRRACGFTGWVLGLTGLGGCGVDPVALPEGALAVVGAEVIGPEDLAGLRQQLGAYAQRRFSGPEGIRHMLEAAVDAKLLEHEAQRAGLARDPRVAWAVHEEIATLYLNAELERRVPEDVIARDEASLRRVFELNLDEFTVPERRSVEGVLVQSFVEADDVLASLVDGTRRLEDVGAVISTPLQARNDRDYPGFHALLFDPGLAVGDWLASAVPTPRGLMVARIKEIKRATAEDFDDPAVRERLVAKVRAPRLDRARREILDELAARFPIYEP